MNRRHILTTTLLGSLAVTLLCYGASDHTQGFPPLAVESIALTPDRIPALRETLRKFAATEHLEFLEGGFPKQGRPVTQFYLKQDDEPAIVISNFRDPLEFRVTAYSTQPVEIWLPRWQRLLTALRSVAIETRK